MAKFKQGEHVKWNWGNGTASGQVKSVFEKKVTRKIKGNEITRNGSRENPAYYIIQEDGGSALKSESELKK
ncbi:MAG: DUF2945 domain-containing protein [Candidatus Cyclobacteriaceae bacterium M3_2C_046]